MNRISIAILEEQVRIINKITGSPEKPYTKDDIGKFRANPGNYHLSYAYGGVKLERICNEGGGVQSISTGGYGTKQELYRWMGAYLAGLESGKL